MSEKSQIYPDKNLFSHVVGQIDDDNNGISGLEKSFDKALKDGRNTLTLTLIKNYNLLLEMN